MGKVLGWIGRHGALIGSFAGGVLVGALLRYPTGWVLPDSSANVIGAAAGALLSVGGAFIVLRSQLAAAAEAQNAARTDAFKHYADALVPILLDVRTFLSQYPGLSYSDVYAYANTLYSTLSSARKDVASFDNYRFELGLEGTRVYRVTRGDFETMWTKVLTIRNAAALAAQQDDARLECRRQYRSLTATHNRIVEEVAKASQDKAYLDLMAPEAVD